MFADQNGVLGKRRGAAVGQIVADDGAGADDSELAAPAIA